MEPSISKVLFSSAHFNKKTINYNRDKLILSSVLAEKKPFSNSYKKTFKKLILKI
jgi:hypothetical protein